MNTQESKRSNAWEWSLKHSPLVHLSRWAFNRGYPNLQTHQLLSESELPPALRTLIDTTVHKAKLWKSERIEITQELIAHTQDALDAGRTAEQITDAFGNPKKVAKLLRRATKRKRPLYWRTLRNMRRAVAASILLIMMTYAGLAARFYIGKPKITENYAVAINAQNDQFSEDQKAWPIYKEVRAAWDLHIKETQDRQYAYEKEYNRNIENGDEAISAGILLIPDIPTDHHDYEETAQLFRDFKPQLDKVRKAAHRPAIGITLGFREGDDWKTPVEVSNHADENPPLNDLLLPYLGPLRRLSQLLYFDALLAARDNNPDLVYQNLSAMLAMTHHHSTDGTLITDLVEIAMLSNTLMAIEQIIREFPNTLSRDHLLALVHELSLCKPVLEYSFEGEIMFFEDSLQRTYTDDGNGNGRMTIEGMEMLGEYASDRDDYFQISKSPVRYATGPVSLAVAPDRKTEYTRYHSMMEVIESVAKAGPRYLPLIDDQDRQLERDTNIIPGIRYSIVDILMPAVGKATERLFQGRMQLDATTTMLAIEIYRIDHSELPESLEDLTPTYLPVQPQDLFNPGHTIKYKRIDSAEMSGYILYSNGSDADDDQGTPYKKKYEYASFSDRFPPSYNSDQELRLDDAGVPIPAKPTGPDGDWVLIDITRIPKTKEPDQSPAPESIN